ncbi:baseplate J/gp47 family protein [Granulosicoccus sp. 3-233]|uniref:baseplate J/gp47 family protein n=1 Tax=Granulosicoccus sp. 3-233 TaxID=3417969 RepID=UPI003D33AAFA
MNQTHERDGTSQADRVQPALSPGYFNVDERGLLQLIALGERLAGNLLFRDLNDRKSGTWEPLFAADELAVMASISSVNIAQLEHLYQSLSAGGDLAAQGRLILDLARRLDQWLLRLGNAEHESAAELAERISRIVEGRLATELHGVLLLLEALREEAYNGETVSATSDRYRFAQVWQAREWAGQSREDQWGHTSTATSASQVDREADADERRSRLLAARFASFIGTIIQLQELVALRLEDSLASGRHEAAFGLYVAFLRLFGRAQDRLNEFPGQRLAFYYQSVLGVSARKARPDHVHLVLEPAAGVSEVKVAADSLFVAGRDSAGRDVTYRADESLRLMPLRVAMLHTSIRARDRLISPETELGLIARSETGSFPDSTGQGRARPMFGVSKLGTGNRPARFGFYTASAALNLAEGDRIIIADIVMTPAPGEVFPEFEDALGSLIDSADDNAFHADLGRILGWELLGANGWLSPEERRRLLAVVAQRFSPGPPERHLAGVYHTILPYLSRERLAIFHELFRDAFLLRFTGPDGWGETSDFHFEPIESAGDTHALGIRLVYRPSASAAAIVPFSRELHGPDFDTNLPVIGLRMNPASSVHVRSLFDQIAVDRVELRVSARGLTSLDLWNQLGRVDPAAPFQPFGPLPDRDSRLVIGCAEAASKNLVAFDVVLDWGGLPLGEGGFIRHYEGYDKRYDTDTLRVRTSVLRHGEWIDEGGGGKPLFVNDGSGNRLDSQRRLPVDVKQFSPLATPPTGTLEYSTRSRDGLLRLSLDPTPHGFGHAEYPRLLTDGLTTNARRRKSVVLPNEPYTPRVNRISIDYVATAVVKADPGITDLHDSSSDRLLHEHPFGWCNAWSPLGREGCPLLPRHPMEGMLLIGLQGVRPEGELKLLFHLNDDASETDDLVNTEIGWFYLASNRWLHLPAKRLLSDTTKGFFRSGIITIKVPADINQDNTLLPGDCWWFAVGANGALNSFPTLYSVSTNALRATRVPATEENAPAEPDPEPGWPGGRGAIWQSAVGGVGRVRQTGVAFGGFPVETPAARQTRVAERLRHKKRAQTPWDYERLILERFPGVAKVKCFTNTSADRDDEAPGHVLVAVVPDINRKWSSSPSTARFDSLELREMRAYLQQSCSPFVTLDVRNPALEQVQVHCAVRLDEDIASGEALRRIDSAISDFISPWKDGGYGVSFGWRIQRKDIEALLSAFPWVTFVTAFSMLRVTRDGTGKYSLDDTAAAGSNGADSILSAEDIARKWRLEELRPSVPWSLAVPSRRHRIEIVRDNEERQPSPAGVGRLEIGSTLILGRQEHS